MFWKSLVLGDMKMLQEIASSWGIPDVSIFASLTLQKRWTKGEPIMKRTGEMTKEERFERQTMVKKRVKDFLGNTEIIPKFAFYPNTIHRELIFTGRTLNIIRANNRYLGTPVSRIGIMSEGAVLALGDDWSIYHKSSQRGSFFTPLMAGLNYWRFKVTLGLIEAASLLSRGIAWARGSVDGGIEKILDDELEEARNRYGLGEKTS